MLKRATDVRVDTFSVFDDGDELARVEVDPDGTIFADYLGLRTPMPGAEVTFFEVRADCRRPGGGPISPRCLRGPAGVCVFGGRRRVLGGGRVAPIPSCGR